MPIGVPDLFALVYFVGIAYLAVKAGQWLRGDIRR
jgi:hypothetical protein